MTTPKKKTPSTTKSTGPKEIPEGSELVDSGVLAQLRKDAADASAARGEAAALRAEVAAGRQAAAQLRQQQHETLVSNAIKAGKFGPARKAAWLKALTIDEAGTIEDLEAMPAGLIPMAQIGDAGSEQGDDEALYDRAFNTGGR